MMMRSLRGSAMVETVVTLGFTLSLIMGTVQMALLGYYQMQLDAATFLNSYEFARTNSLPAAAVASPLPELSAMTITVNPTSPPNTETTDNNATTVLEEYTQEGFAGGTVDEETNRYAGAAILRPQQVSTKGTMAMPSLNMSTCTGSQPALSFCVPLVSSLTLNSGNIEGRTMVANHDDDGSGQGYNSGPIDATGGAVGLVNPLSVGGDDQDVPPYYFAQGFMPVCVAADPCLFNRAFTSVGGPAQIQSLGLAEFLQDASEPGGSNGNYSTSTNVGNGIGAGAVFSAMSCHQKMFAMITQDMVTSYPGTAAGYLAADTTAGKNAITATYSAAVNQWDHNLNTQGSPTAGNFGVGAGSKPTTPTTPCVP